MKKSILDYLVLEVSIRVYGMTYFSFFPESLKQRGLKVGKVFVHSTFRFEVWLFGYNKGVQAKYWKVFKESGWDKYRIPLFP